MISAGGFLLNNAHYQTLDVDKNGMTLHLTEHLVRLF